MPLEIFSKTSLPETVPKEMQVVIDELMKTSDQEECLRRAYDLMISRYHGNRMKTFTRLLSVFQSDIEALWNSTGFMHCTNINHIMKTLLIRSQKFSEQDIRSRWTQIWLFSPHQYLQVRIGPRWIDVDIWAHAYGIRFGDRAHGFH